MDLERYSRQLVLAGFGETAQQKLLKAKVLVIGAGGLGCPALQYLVASGVGSVGIVDDDTISLSNLHRQILYATNDIGKLKAKTAAEKLAALNPEVEITPYTIWLDQENILELFARYDFILDGTDNFESRYLINDACAMLKKPLIFAAVSGYEGQLAVFNLTDDQQQCSNYRDLFPIPPTAGEIPNCEENGVLGVLPGIIGTMAAAEIIKLITEKGKPLINKLLHYNLLTQEQYVLKISSAQNYKIAQSEDEFLKMNYHNHCALTEAYSEIDISKMLALKEIESTILIDVRERHEVPQLDPQIFSQVPMSELEHFLETDIAAEHIVILCQHGIRSVAAAERLSEKYGHTKKIYSLKGGIAKWRNHF
jgi:adenylyltransferase/sulfurtransferase